MEGRPLAVGVAHRYEVVCCDAEGVEKWRDAVHNLVVDEGLDFYLDQLTAAAATLSLGLTDGTPTVASGDTMASHAGWVEVTAYDEAARPSPTFGAASGQERDNSGDVAVFTMNGSGTAGGVLVSTNATKGGTTGTLLGAGAFDQGDKPFASGDTIRVTQTLSMQAV